MESRHRLNLLLWIVQSLVASVLFYAAAMKLFADKALLNDQWPWTAAHPALTTFTGFTDLAGGIGLLLPGILKWSRQWTVAAAAGVLLLMITAVIFHLSRGESESILFNGFMAVCCCLIIWGRRT